MARKGFSQHGTDVAHGRSDGSTLPQRRLSRWILLALPLLTLGCAHRPHGWGLSGGQGTIERQKSRAVVHDPYPLNDIGPEVIGGRPREFYWPKSEASREAAVPLQYRNLPPGY